MPNYRAAVDPPVPETLSLPQSQQTSGSTLKMIGLALVLCCLLNSLNPRIVGELAASADLSSLRGLLVLLVCWLLSILWHESGHLIAALAVGFDVAGVAFGPVRASRLGGRWSIQLSGQTPLSASVSAFPRRSAAFDGPTWRRGVLIVVTGGPLATLTAAAASLIVFRHASLNALDRCFFAFGAQLNALIFLLGLLPNKPNAAVPNDARIALVLVKGGDQAQTILLYHLIVQYQREGFRPCFYPGHLIRAAARALAPAEFRVVFAQAISEWALDRGYAETAEAWDRFAMDNAQSCSVRTYNRATAQSACLDLLLRHDWDATTLKCSELDVPSLTPDWLRHRTQAIALLCRGQIPDGMSELQRAERCLPSCVPYFTFHQELLQQIKLRAIMRNYGSRCFR